ncbi:MAG: hypothetical protein JWQ30_991 [Sediminibacterium sp.]|nr:hypothetical protein [Sediminibacterium sp.]
MIDSAVLSTYHHKCTLYRIPWGATVTKIIPRDSIQLNTHNFTLAASLYGFNLPQEGVSTYWYDDLSGSPAKLYTVILTGDRKVNIISTW